MSKELTVRYEEVKQTMHARHDTIQAHARNGIFRNPKDLIQCLIGKKTLSFYEREMLVMSARARFEFAY